MNDATTAALSAETVFPRWSHDSEAIRLCLVLAFALLIAARIPAVFLVGRFWAEEGVIFYQNAVSEAWWLALTAVRTG